MQNVDDHESTSTVRPSGSRPHQLRGSIPAGCEADREPECRTDVAALAGCEQSGPGLTGGEPRSGEGAPPPGAPGGDGSLLAAAWQIVDELRGLRSELRRGAGGQPPSARVEWTDLDVEHAKRAQAKPQLNSLRPLEIKTPNERALLERLSGNRGRKNDR
jgi:hypothetical protein